MIRDIGPRFYPTRRYRIKPLLLILLLVWDEILIGYSVKRYIYGIVSRNEISIGYSKFKGAK